MEKCNQCKLYKRTPGDADVGKCPVSNDVNGDSPVCVVFVGKYEVNR
jgi:hypothetical protein